VDRACRADYENRLPHRKFEVEVRGGVGWEVVLALNRNMRVWRRLIELLILDAGGIETGLGLFDRVLDRLVRFGDGVEKVSCLA
jgi:hypothetical protein